MPARLFRQRSINRRFDRLDTGTNSGAYSFHNRNTRISPESAAVINILANRQPLTRYDISGKTVDREDAILYTDFDIPSYSKIIGGYLQMTSAASSSGNLVNLHLAVYPQKPNGQYIDLWRGAPPEGRSKYKWIHVPTAQRAGVNTTSYEADNMWVKIYEGANIRAQTSIAAAGAAVSNADRVGSFNPDRDDTTLRGATHEAVGQVVQIEVSSSAITSIGFKVRKQGVIDLGNVVLRVYNYDANTHTIGGLRATSDPIDSFSIPSTTPQPEVSFTFTTTFPVTANEYVLVTLEPETTWKTVFDGFLSPGKRATYNTALSGANPAGSKEIMWKKVLDIGNSTIFFGTDEMPCLYTGETGLTIEDTPYQSVIDISSVIGGPITTVNQVAKFPIGPKMLRALERYVRDPDVDQINGLQWYLGAGTSNTGTINWSIDRVQTTGLYLAYRSTRTFIT